ncbi:MAG: RsmD family RNA methyltransferase, partial [Candidatus Methylomirabilales bacterium]
TFLENDRGAIRALERNLVLLGFTGRARILRGDALRQPPPGSRFDLIFVDPPFALFEEERPRSAVIARVESLIEGALAPAGTLVFRHPASRALEIGAPADDRRTFGGSVALFFRRR